MTLISEVTSEIISIDISVIVFFWELVVWNILSSCVLFLELLGSTQCSSEFGIAWCSKALLVIFNVGLSFDINIINLGK